jgi:hypothetical protein
VRVWDRSRAFALIGEAVWWVTLVDATLVRYHAGAYDAVVAGQPPTERWLTEATLTGLRFVRNRIGRGADLAEFVEPGAGHPWVTGWTWRPVPEPALAALAPRARAWESARYRAYRAQLAGRTIGETFGRAAAFLTLTAADAAPAADVSVYAAR